MSLSSGAQPSIEGDGFIANLYQYLWMKDDLKRGPVGVRIPDTVLFRFRRPVAWYFTSRDGAIKRKHRQNVQNARILEAFTDSPSHSDIVASFIDLSDAPCACR